MTRARDLANSVPGSVGESFRTAAGVVSVSATNAAQYGYTWGATGVTFPASRFTVAPRLSIATVQNGSSNIPVMTWSSAPSTSGCTMWAWAAFGTTWDVQWNAVQMTSSAASG